MGQLCKKRRGWLAQSLNKPWQCSVGIKGTDVRQDSIPHAITPPGATARTVNLSQVWLVHAYC